MTPALLPPSLDVSSPAGTGASREPGTPVADAFEAQVASEFQSVAVELQRSALFSTSVRDNMRQAADYSQTLMHSYRSAIDDINRTKESGQWEAEPQELTAEDMATFMEGIREGIREELDRQGLTESDVDELMASGDLGALGANAEAQDFFEPLREALAEAVEGFRAEVGQAKAQEAFFGDDDSRISIEAREVPEQVQQEIRKAEDHVEGKAEKREKGTAEDQFEAEAEKRKTRKSKAEDQEEGTVDPGFTPATLPTGPDSEKIKNRQRSEDPDNDPSPGSRYTMESWSDGTNWENVRGYSAERANQWISEWNKRSMPEVEDALDANGNPIKRYLDPEAGAAWEQQSARIGKVQGALTNFGEGGVAGEGGMLQGAMKGVKGVGAAASVIGAVVMALQKIYEVGMDQTSQYYEERGALRQSSRTGGDEDMGDVITERPRRWINKYFSEEALFMGSDQAEALYSGLTDMGLRGDERRMASDFALAQYQRSGMDVNTSLDLLEQSVDNGITDFTKLAEALDAVNQSAAEGGVTLKQAGEQFTQLFTVINQNVTSGEGATALAADISGISNRMGQGLASVDYTNSVASRPAQYAYANSTGQDVGQVQANVMRGDSATTSAMTAYATDRLNRIVFSSVGGIQGAVDQLSDYIASEGPFDSDEDKRELGAVALERGLYNLDHVRKVASQLGIEIEGGDVGLFVGAMLANVAEGKAAVDTQSTMQAKKSGQFTDDQKGKIDGDKIDKFGKNLAVKIPGRDSEFVFQPGRQTFQEERLKGEFKDEIDTEAERHAWKAYADPTKTVSFSKDGITKQRGGMIFNTGERDKAIENLFKADLSDDTMFKVKDKDKDGKTTDREVTFAEAISRYSEQLSSGEAEIVAGNKKGQRVGDVSGVWDTKGDKKKKEDDKRQKVDVSISPKGGLEKFLKFQVGGSGDIDDARAAGEAPRSLPNPLNLPGWFL